MCYFAVSFATFGFLRVPLHDVAQAVYEVFLRIRAASCLLGHGNAMPKSETLRDFLGPQHFFLDFLQFLTNFAPDPGTSV